MTPDAPLTPEGDGIELRELRSAAELAVLPPFERRIWGDTEMVSVNMLVATVSEGGMAIGAFAPGGRLVGAVYGFATSEPDVLHSHYLAVDPTHRRRRLGLRLKLAQRDWCLARGVSRVRWTYDPLQLANGQFNLQVLGAVGTSYHVDHYGTLGGINGGLPSDRVTVTWHLHGRPSLPDPELEVPVPEVTPEAIQASTPGALAARLAVRDAMAARLGEGWVVSAVDVPGRRYLLARGLPVGAPPSPAPGTRG